MKNITKKELQRMKELMGNKTPINENKVISSVELVKKSPDGKYYGIVRETKRYYIKESDDGSNFDFIGGVANKNKNQFESYEQAVRRLNLMLEDTDVLTPDIIEEKKFVIKTKKKKAAEPKAEGGFDFGGDEGSSEESGEEGGDFDFGGGEEDTEGSEDFDFGGGEGGFDFGGGKDTEGSSDEETDEDLDLEDEGEDSIKSIQKMTGKLGQKIRDTEDLSSDIMKWVAKSVLSALDLEEMDSEDKKDLIRTIKKKKDEGSDEEFDFMDDNTSDDNMVDWNKLSDEEKAQIVNYPGDEEKPIMDWDVEIEDDSCPHCGGLGHDDMTGDECEWCMGTGVEHMEDYMEDDMYGPGDGELKAGEEILSDDEDEDHCSYCGDRNKPYYEDQTEMGGYPGMEEDWMSDPEDEYDNVSVGQESFMDDEDYMSRFAKNVKRAVAVKGKKMDTHELDSHLNKIKNKLGGSDNVSIDGDKVVGNFGYVEVKPNGYTVHKEGEKFGETFQFHELGKLHDYVRDIDEDYMDDPYMMPQPAPSRPETRPDTPIKPAKPDTDKPSPSKRPFTPPPHITPGEEPNPKAEYDEYGVEDYGPTEGMDYMEDDDDEMEICSACQGRGHEQGRIGFVIKANPCITCAGTGRIPRMEVDGEVDEPYVDPATPIGYEDEGSSTLPKGIRYKFQYREKFNFPFNMGENSKRNKRTIKEDHLNNKMASYEQDMAYEDVETMARQHGMDVEFCHKDRAKDPEEQTIYLDLMKKGKAVAKIRINTAGQIEMGDMKGQAFKGEPVDSHSDFDEVLGEKNIKLPMNPAPAPARPQTRPETPTKPTPTKPGTDKPSPSKRPFTPPPHITPGEEPNPKARFKK